MRSWLLIFVFCSGAGASAEVQKVEIGGAVRARAEFRDDADFSNASKDYTDSVASRVRLDFKAQASTKAFVFVQPQFTKVWGEPELVPTTATTNTATASSGATNDTPLDVHQAFLTYAQSERFSFTVGRRELNYGDEVLVGGVGWSNTGRSFDLIQSSFKHSLGTVDAFHSRLVDRNSGAAGGGDRDFSGVYGSFSAADWLKAADVYILYLDDPASGPATSTAAYGARLKSPVGAVDYRSEITFESIKTTTKSDELQYDLELGYTFAFPGALRLAAEYFHASENFDQLFPTGHKWLGYADLFSRRNIEGYRARVTAQPRAGFTASVDYYRFQRVKTDQAAYRFGGGAYGAAGSERAIAQELDLVIGYKLDESVTLEAGGARAVAGPYLKDNGGPDQASFYYLQINTLF